MYYDLIYMHVHTTRKSLCFNAEMQFYEQARIWCITLIIWLDLNVGVKNLSYTYILLSC